MRAFWEIHGMGWWVGGWLLYGGNDEMGCTLEFDCAVWCGESAMRMAFRRAERGERSFELEEQVLLD